MKDLHLNKCTCIDFTHFILLFILLFYFCCQQLNAEITGYTVSIQTETSDYQCRELHVMLETH